MMISGIVRHLGVFRRSLSLWEGVALIISGTVGAGVLALPYAIARIGIVPGLLVILFLGLCMIGLHLLLGEVAIRAKQELQLAGLAMRYLGPVGRWTMTAIVYTMLALIMVVYLVGIGQSLAAILGGPSFQWSMLFFLFGACAIAVGLRTIKTIEFFLTIGILVLVASIALFSVPYLSFPEVQFSFANLLFPYGVVLFAFHAASAIPEAHALLKNRQQTFRQAIVIAGAIVIVLYSLFAATVVGVLGIDTTEIATIGLGLRLGPHVLLFGNLFAVLAMATSYLLVGLSFRDSLAWDFRVPRRLATLLVTGIPLAFFLFGLRRFVALIDIVGGIFISIEMALILLIYWRAKEQGDIPIRSFRLYHGALLLAIVSVALAIGTIWSVVKFF